MEPVSISTAEMGPSPISQPAALGPPPPAAGPGPLPPRAEAGARRATPEPAAPGAMTVVGMAAAITAAAISYVAYARALPFVPSAPISVPPGYGLPQPYFNALLLATALPAVVLLVRGAPSKHRWQWLLITMPLSASIVIGSTGATWFYTRSRSGLAETVSTYVGLETFVTLVVAVSCAVALGLVIRVGHSWSWTRPALLYVPPTVAIAIALVAALYFQSLWTLTPAAAPEPDPIVAARAAYSHALNDWFAKINPIGERLDSCTDASCRKAALTDFLTALGAFDGAVRRLAVPAPYVSDWLALERADYTYEVQLLQGFQSSAGLAIFSAAADQYTAARDLARDLEVPGY